MFPAANVSVSGPAFSFLLYETCKFKFHQEGFLLGEIVHKETTSITDNDQQQVNVLKLIKVNSVIPCPENYFFCKGRVNRERIQQFLGDQMNNVVGWYKFQNNDTFKFSWKNKIVHNQLKQLFRVPPDLFSCCLLLTECSDNESTHIYSQMFIRYHHGLFDKLTMHIPNLSEPNNTYKNCEPASEVFNEILSNLNDNIKNSRGVIAVTEIEDAVQSHINGTVKKLALAEMELFNLETEIQELRMRLQAEDADVDIDDTTIRKASCRNNIDNNENESKIVHSGHVNIVQKRMDNGDDDELLDTSQGYLNNDSLLGVGMSPLVDKDGSPELQRKSRPRPKKMGSFDQESNYQETKIEEKTAISQRGRGRGRGRGRK